MNVQTKRATIYFDTDLPQGPAMQGRRDFTSITDLVNEAVRQALSEDAEDLSYFVARTVELLVGYEEMVKKLKADGRI